MDTNTMMTVTLCGSTKFKDDFKLVETKLALRGWAVYSCAFWGHADNVPLLEDQKLMLDAVHMLKITNSDAVCVINPGGYHSESTRRKVYFAASMGLPITFLEPEHDFARAWARGVPIFP